MINREYYFTVIFICKVSLLNVKLASSKLGGPNIPRALLENPYFSVGIPKKFVSKLSLEFSS